jgi:hypothetical protein
MIDIVETPAPDKRDPSFLPSDPLEAWSRGYVAGEADAADTIERLRADITDFQAAVDYLTADYTACCTDRTRLTAEVERLRAALVNQGARIERLRAALMIACGHVMDGRAIVSIDAALQEPRT